MALTNIKHGFFFFPVKMKLVLIVLLVLNNSEGYFESGKSHSGHPRH